MSSDRIRSGRALTPAVAGLLLALVTRDASRQPTAFKLFGVSFLRETLTGALPGVSAMWLLLAVVPGAIAVWGMWTLARRAPLITSVLLGSQILFSGVVLVLDWPVYPRLFILGLPLVILALATILDAAPMLVPQRWARLRLAAGPGALGVLVVGFGLMLPRLYATPKQPYRAALAEAVRLSEPGGFLVAVGVADRGIRYYEPEMSAGSPGVGYARTLEAFDALLRDHPARRVVLLSTFDRALATRSPELWSAMQAAWQPSVTLEGTVRGGA